MRIIDYDEIDIWGLWLGEGLADITPADTMNRLSEPVFRYVEDAGDLLVKSVGRERLIEHMNGFLADYRVRVYHGSRLTDGDTEKVRTEGLRPLVVAERRAAIEEALAGHPRWAEVKDRLDQILIDIGPGEYAGRREDKSIHVCFSRAGLLRGCNHYLKAGAEVDGHIAYRLFGDLSANEFFASRRKPRLVTFVASYPDTAAAANPWGVPDDDLPSFMGELVRSWAYRQGRAAFTVASQRSGVAARFPGPILAQDIEAVVDVEESELT